MKDLGFRVYMLRAVDLVFASTVVFDNMMS